MMQDVLQARAQVGCDAGAGSDPADGAEQPVGTVVENTSFVHVQGVQSP